MFLLFHILYFFDYLWYNKCKKSLFFVATQEVRKECMRMNEAAAEARRAYRREWARKNPDKIRAQQERYWAKKAAKAEQAERAEQAAAPTKAE